MARTLGLRVDSGNKKFSEALKARADDIPDIALATLKEIGQETVDETFQDVQSAGKFGSRWKLEYNIEGTSGEYDLVFSTNVPYYTVFQTGKLIQGKPLLAIPLSFAGVPPGMFARNYPGGLFRVDRSGKASLLLSRADKKPKYFLKESVTIPKKFHTLEIIAQKAKEITARFLGKLRNG